MVRRPGAVLLAAALVLSGCSTVDSADIRTSGLTGKVVVSIPEGATSADVSVSLTVGTLTFVELGRGEQLTATGGGKAVTLMRQNVAGATSYRGRLDGVHAAGTEIVVDLRREADNASAPRSSVRLPAAVTLTAPSPGERFSRARNDIRVRIGGGPSDAPGILTWAGDCIVAGSIELEPGRRDVTISRGTIKRATPPSPATSDESTCRISLTLTRREEGQLDPAFKNGSIRAETQAVRQVTSAP